MSLQLPLDEYIGFRLWEQGSRDFQGQLDFMMDHITRVQGLTGQIDNIEDACRLAARAYHEAQKEKTMPDLPKKSVPQINQRKAIAAGQTVKGLPNQAKLAGVKKPGK